MQGVREVKEARAPALRRELGRWDLTAIGVNQVIGSAIFLLPANVAREVGAWGPVAFLAVGLSSLLIAMCFAEVGSRFDRTGGPYLPARVAYGRFVGFELGWMMWFTRVSSQASVANGLAQAMAFYWRPFETGIPRLALMTTLSLILMWVNIRGIKLSSWVVNGLTLAKLVPLALFVLVGMWFIDFSRFADLPPVALDSAAAAALLLVFAYGGYEITGVAAGEAVNPRRDVPFAFIMTIVIVAIVMTLTSIVATGVLPDVAASRTPLADGAAILMGAAGAFIISAGSVASMSGNNMGGLLSGSRIVFALAENGDLPRWFGRIHPRYRTPVNATIFSTVVVLLLAYTGSFVQLAAVSAVARLMTYVAVCTATLVLRRRTPDAVVGPAQYTTPFGPVIPVLATMASLSILAGATTQQLLMGTYALIGGAVLFLIAVRSARQHASA